MQYLILSDMHGNAEALQAVLRHIRRKRFDAMLCSATWSVTARGRIRWWRRCRSRRHGLSDPRQSRQGRRRSRRRLQLQSRRSGRRAVDDRSPDRGQSTLRTRAASRAAGPRRLLHLSRFAARRGSLRLLDFEAWEIFAAYAPAHLLRPHSCHLVSRWSAAGSGGGAAGCRRQRRSRARFPVSDQSGFDRPAPGSRSPRGLYDLRQRRGVRWHRVAYPVDRAQQRIFDAGLPAVLADRLAVGMYRLAPGRVAPPPAG